MSQVSKFDQGFSLVRDASVEVQAIHSKREERARIIVDDKFVHEFSGSSSISEAAHQNLEKVRERLNGGTFFFHNDAADGDTLVSYRDRNYNGFTHSDDNINALLDHIGHTTDFSRAQHHNNSTSRLRLQNVHSNVEMNIAHYHTGGEMNSELSFAWDPFQAHIRAVFRLVRLVCANGMIGLADFMNAKIPVISDWQEHMEIANKQIQNRLGSIIHRRMDQMSMKPATVRDCQRIVDACRIRLDSPLNQNDQKAMQHINHIALAADPNLHLNGHYPDEVFNDRRLSEQAASHLTEFTAWNLATELVSHTTGSGNNSDRALYKHANELLIDRGDSRFQTITNNNKSMSQATVKFDDIDAAFAGDLIEA